jgi:hypothetical protein
MPTADDDASPMLSVVVPLYNKRRTVLRTLDSVLAQTYRRLDVVVVDDGSTDGGAELVQAHCSDRRVRVHRQANAGPAAARNRGLALSQGAYVAFLDADDTWRPEFAQTVVDTFAAHPECGAFTAAFTIGPERVDRWQALLAYGFHEGPWRLAPEIRKEHLRHALDAFNATTAAYRREVAEGLGGFFIAERSTFGEDVYLWLQVLLHYPIYRHMRPLAHYHTEDSELGIGGRRGALPVEPVLTHPGPVRANCPPHLRETLELWLAQHAARAAFMQLERGDDERARWLLAQFPRIRAWPSDYFKLRLRLALPGLWRLSRRVKASARMAQQRGHG